jgi:Mg-chelatase subunit ChlD
MVKATLRFVVCLGLVSLVIACGTARGQQATEPAVAGPVTFQGLKQLLRTGQDEVEILKLLEQSPLDVSFVLGDSQRADLKKMRVSDEFIEGVQKVLDKRQRIATTDVTDLLLIFDSSGSMLEKTKDGVSKLQAAKEVINDLIKDFPAGRRLGLIVYGADARRACESVDVVRPLSEFDDAARAKLREYISKLDAKGHTPIARALEVTAGEMAQVKGLSRVVLITDGMETCHGDPVNAASELVAKTNTELDVIGFGLKPEESQAVEKIAKAGRGKYYDAQTAQKLQQDLRHVAKLTPVPPPPPPRERTEDQLAVFTDHQAAVTSVALSRDGKTAVCATQQEGIVAKNKPGNAVRRWDVETGKPLDAESWVPNDLYKKFTLSPDGRHMLTNQAGSVVNLWDVSARKQLLDFSVAMHRHGVAFSPNGRWFIIGCQEIRGDPFVGVWDAETGRQVQVFKEHRDYAHVHAVALSADGRLAASADRKEGVRLWEVASGKQLQQLQRRGVLTMAFSPDGKYLATGESLNVVVLWDTSTGQEAARFVGHNGGVPAITFSPDGQFLVSGGEDGTVRLWETGAGKELKRFEGHTAEVKSVAVSADGKRAISGSKDKTARVWNIAKYTAPPR